MNELFLSIVVPAYNEALRIGPSLVKIRQYLATKDFLSEVIVVDDGSNDGSDSVLSHIAADWPSLRILRNERNRGKGYSVRRGVLEAKGEFVLFSDADLSAPVEQADGLVAAMQSVRADAVVGSRALQRALIGVHQPLLRECAGVCFNILVRLFTGLQIRDTQCGLKLFRRHSTRWAFECQSVEGFGFDPELLFLIKRSGGNILEVPVRWNNDPASKVRFLRDSTRMLLELISLRWQVLTGGVARPAARDLMSS
jgi:dolichyl-phosphate beta-glucosyltransferase